MQAMPRPPVAGWQQQHTSDAPLGGMAPGQQGMESPDRHKRAAVQKKPRLSLDDGRQEQQVGGSQRLCLQAQRIRPLVCMLA